MTRYCVALAAAALCAAAANADLLCRTHVVVEPTTAFVGQQLLYRLQIFRHSDVESVRFTRDLGFPSFRAEWLPGQAPDAAIADIGDHALVFEERRALFPARAGDLETDAARLACKSAAETLEVDVPSARVTVRELPDMGRPAAFSGVVGPVVVQSYLARNRMALGESVELTITVRGAANVWDAKLVFDPARDLPGVDVYAQAPETERDAGRRLEVRRTFAYELVPRSAGSFAIPALRVPWFDPATERYETAVAAALAFTVVAASSGSAPVAESAGPARRDAATAAPRGAIVAIGLAIAAIVAFAVAAFLRLRRREVPGTEALLAAARDASARGDADGAARALAGALRAALEARLSATNAQPIETIALRSDDASLRAVAEALGELDRARFGTTAPAPRALDVERVRALIQSIRRS